MYGKRWWINNINLIENNSFDLILIKRIHRVLILIKYYLFYINNVINLIILS